MKREYIELWACFEDEHPARPGSPNKHPQNIKIYAVIVYQQQSNKILMKF